MLRYAGIDSPKKGGQHAPEWQVVFKAIFMRYRGVSITGISNDWFNLSK